MDGRISEAPFFAQPGNKLPDSIQTDGLVGVERRASNAALSGIKDAPRDSLPSIRSQEAFSGATPITLAKKTRSASLPILGASKPLEEQRRATDGSDRTLPVSAEKMTLYRTYQRELAQSKAALDSLLHPEKAEQAKLTALKKELVGLQKEREGLAESRSRLRHDYAELTKKIEQAQKELETATANAPTEKTTEDTEENRLLEDAVTKASEQVKALIDRRSGLGNNITKRERENRTSLMAKEREIETQQSVVAQLQAEREKAMKGFFAKKADFTIDRYSPKTVDQRKIALAKYKIAVRTIEVEVMEKEHRLNKLTQLSGGDPAEKLARLRSDAHKQLKAAETALRKSKGIKDDDIVGVKFELSHSGLIVEHNKLLDERASLLKQFDTLNKNTTRETPGDALNMLAGFWKRQIPQNIQKFTTEKEFHQYVESGREKRQTKKANLGAAGGGVDAEFSLTPKEKVVQDLNREVQSLESKYPNLFPPDDFSLKWLMNEIIRMNFPS